ncbi:Derlin [Fasciolopsis buskii]|uniref:Derlin n=1 Tax=Fasciolopsis buskii TaxID=27845 RepID=A0A8E0S8D8_9TREM|nr:Derlin [Fasciolopsis buski]
MELTGIIIGHVYYFFTFQYPQEYGGQMVLKTPDFLYRLFPNQRGYVSGFGRAPAPAAGSSGSSSSAPRFPGRGQALGRDD